MLPLFPQRTASSSGTVERLVAELSRRPELAGRLRPARLAPDAPGYVAALAERARGAIEASDPAPDHLVVSFHGIPASVDRREGGVYAADCRATERALVRRAGLGSGGRATLAFQSKFGPGRWLTPATADVLAELPSRGVRRVAVITPGFLTDGLETLEEIGIRGRESFLEAGGESLTLVPAVVDHPSLVDAILEAAGNPAP